METRILLANSLKIVSGGQTGADRAALDWAIAHQVSHGGWCPKGRKAEDGILDARYNLTETPSSEYSERTEWNVRDSDGTVIFSIDKEIFEGTLLTVELAKKYEKPCIHICRNLTDINPVSQFQLFLSKFGIVNLNIAGTRASGEPEVYQFVREILDRAFLP
ncbi:putative molybdenum carrier protein [Calothrix sp. UHCC 0171]|uniref:putative molybdenum carrier protein n=1 Tax=Calothrix sp. UHCC 0171 TaxID=3110245 RepID=UPI002B1EF617|nr:putative molybdenum carrier protein [Calothrix sp. UHCC 0171]MEA5573857.1 putative molybdenum carrier protein [Calothrix sp. UHCC 0171]